MSQTDPSSRGRDGPRRDGCVLVRRADLRRTSNGSIQVFGSVVPQLTGLVVTLHFHNETGSLQERPFFYIRLQTHTLLSGHHSHQKVISTKLVCLRQLVPSPNTSVCLLWDRVAPGDMTLGPGTYSSVWPFGVKEVDILSFGVQLTGSTNGPRSNRLLFLDTPRRHTILRKWKNISSEEKHQRCWILPKDKIFF